MVSITAAISSVLVTGSEHRSPTQTKAALAGAGFSFSCAGWAAGRSVADAARSTMRSVNGNFSAAVVSATAFGILTGGDDLGAAQAQVQCIKQCHMPEQIALGRQQNALDQPVGLLAPLVIAGEHGEAHQVLRRHRVRIRRGVVLGRMRPQQQIVGVVGAPEIAAGAGVGVMRIERALPERPARARRVRPWPR